MPLYLEDLHIGQRFISGTATVTADQIVEFAAQYDPQPFHLTEEDGKRSLFGGLVASGWHTAAIAMRLFVDGELKLAGGMIGGGGELQWTHPVRPGDSLTVHSEILELAPSRSRPERGSALVRSETRNQDGVVVQIFTARMVVLRRPSAT